MLGTQESLKEVERVAEPINESAFTASMVNELGKNRSKTNKRTILQQEIDDSISHVMKLREQRHKSFSRNEQMCAQAYLTGTCGDLRSSHAPMKISNKLSESKKRKKSVSCPKE